MNFGNGNDIGQWEALHFYKKHKRAVEAFSALQNSPWDVCSKVLKILFKKGRKKWTMRETNGLTENLFQENKY